MNNKPQYPVRQAPAAPPVAPEQTYAAIVDALKANNGAEAKAIRAMFGGDKALMDRFLSVTFSLLARDSDLLRRATPMSIVDAIKTAASMGLEPMTGDGAIVCYGNTAAFMPMWQGYVKRIRNSREVVDVDVQVVYENDLFELHLGTDPSIRHVPARVVKDPGSGRIVEDRGSYLGVYAWASMPSGKYIIEWMTEAEINQIRDKYGNRAADARSPWAGAWGEMARKTVIRRLAKRLPSAAVDKLLAAESRIDQFAAESDTAMSAATPRSSAARTMAMRAVTGHTQKYPGHPADEEPRESPHPERSEAQASSNADA